MLSNIQVVVFSNQSWSRSCHVSWSEWCFCHLVRERSHYIGWDWSCWGCMGWKIIQQVPSYTMMGISRGDSVPTLTFSPLGEACSRNDLTAVHEILVKTGYKDDEGTDNEVLFSKPPCLLCFLWRQFTLQVLIVGCEERGLSDWFWLLVEGDDLILTWTEFSFLLFSTCKRKWSWGLQLSFQVWTKQMQDMLNSRKRGDMAFREKEFRVAIDCYSQVSALP